MQVTVWPVSWLQCYGVRKFKKELDNQFYSYLNYWF